MIFIVPINEAQPGESQTCDIVDTESDCPRTNKRKLKDYFMAQGVPKGHLKRVMKAFGFWGEGLRP